MTVKMDENGRKKPRFWIFQAPTSMARQVPEASSLIIATYWASKTKPKELEGFNGAESQALGSTVL